MFDILKNRYNFSDSQSIFSDTMDDFMKEILLLESIILANCKPTNEPFIFMRFDRK